MRPAMTDRHVLLRRIVAPRPPYHHHRSRRKPPGRLLDHRAEREQRLLVERPADQLQRRAAGPRADSPAGTEMPGRPAMFTVTVNTSLRYISTGSACALLADAEGGRRRRRRQDRVDALGEALPRSRA